ncbi:MAG: extracellular solute-binding protein [Candidatus Falkowbacteria bacterium]
MKNKTLAILLLLVFILTTGFGCKVQSTEVKAGLKPIKLTYWRVWDDQDAFASQITKYQLVHPNVSIEYRKFRYEEYESQLLDAFAEDRGPDIFSIPNTWVKRYVNKIEPLPDSTTLVFKVTQGTIKKEVIDELRTNKTMTLKEVKNNFADVVYGDVVAKGLDAKNLAKEQILALPLYVDTLALYFNKDLFNNAGIAEPPEFWNKTFQQDVKKLTKQDASGKIAQSGVALGGGTNIQRSFDILSVLMMQNGAEMTTDSGGVIFNEKPKNTSVSYNPGPEALRFYTDFGNPAKEVYSWNKDQPDSLQLFTNGQLAMMFGYAYHLPMIKAAAPKMNFSVVKLPQIENSNQPVNYANYWVETVSKKILTNPENLKNGASYAKLKRDSAWDFVQFLSKEEQAKSYVQKAMRPTALRSLVTKQGEDPEIGIFASQVLTSKSWYQGKDVISAEKIFNDMIDQALLAPDNIDKIMDDAVSKVQQTIN